jgi:hypothetical protein
MTVTLPLWALAAAVVAALVAGAASVFACRRARAAEAEAWLSVRADIAAFVALAERLRERPAQDDIVATLDRLLGERARRRAATRARDTEVS